jgi:hypothetical protein
MIRLAILLAPAASITVIHLNMKTEEVARRLVALCREAKWEAAQKELYAADAVSIEPDRTPGV